VCALLPMRRLRRGFYIEWVTLLFFVATALLLKCEWYRCYASFICTSTLAIIAWLTLLLGCPFTMQYAKEKVAEKYWESYLFKRINYLMTLSYGLLFLTMTVLKAIDLFYPEKIPFFALTVGLSLAQIVFNQSFPKWYEKRYCLRHGETH
jgi:hypothetical protein